MCVCVCVYVCRCFMTVALQALLHNPLFRNYFLSDLHNRTRCNLGNGMLCYVMLCYVMLCYVMLCYVMLCYVMLCSVISGLLLCHCISVEVSFSLSLSLSLSSFFIHSHTTYILMYTYIHTIHWLTDWQYMSICVYECMSVWLYVYMSI